MLDAIAGIIHSLSNVSIAGIIAHMASVKGFQFNAFTLTVIVIGVCAIASIILRLVPKKKPVDVTAIPTVQVPMTNISVDYQEYLKYKTLASKYEAEEAFSFSKFFSGFGKSKNWAKAIAIGVMMTIILVIGYSVTKELSSIFGKPPVVSTITNTGGGTVESKTESKSTPKTSNGLNLNIFSSWF